MPKHVRPLWFLTAGFWLASAPAWAGDGRFGAGEEIPVAEARSVAVGDFDADGRPDVAAVNRAGGHVVVRLGRAGGPLTPAANVAVGSAPEALVVADFDADGNDDLAVTRPVDSRVTVRLGKGDGTFSASPPEIALARLPLSLVAGDFNGDGREDLAVTTGDSTSHALDVRLGRGDGSFERSGLLGVFAGSLAVGDFNADGDQDLVVGGYGSDPPGRVLLGRGDGTFAIGPDVELPSRASYGRALSVGDFNADGHHDVAAALIESDLVSVRLGRGDATFAAAPDLPVGDSPFATAAGDFDSDGNEDLVVANYDGDSVSVRLGDGAGGFRRAPDAAAGDAPLDVAPADFDGDGNDDLAIANTNGSLSVRPGLGTPPLAGNLLVNGGFEGPDAGPATQRPLPTIPGWERRGGIVYTRYGLPSSVLAPSRLAAPRHLGGGLGLLAGGSSAATDGVTSAFQTVDVSAAAASIDAGLATTRLSAHLGGALAIGDRMDARAEFLGGTGVQLGSFAIGPVTAADRRNLTTLVRRSGGAPVPAGTRRIRVTLTSTDDDKSYSSAVADNVELRLDAPPPAPPPGGPRADREPPLIRGLRLGREVVRRGRGTTIRFTLSEPAAVTLRFQRAARRRYVTAVTLRRRGRSGANRVAFRGRRLARGAYRLVVTAVDVAGNRSASRTKRFRVVG